MASRLANIKAQMKKDIVNFTHEQASQVRSLIETCLEQNWRKLIIDREKIGIINEKAVCQRFGSSRWRLKANVFIESCYRQG